MLYVTPIVSSYLKMSQVNQVELFFAGHLKVPVVGQLISMCEVSLMFNDLKNV